MSTQTVPIELPPWPRQLELGRSQHPFDHLIPITMSHYPITYSSVINGPDDQVLDGYMSRLQAPVDNPQPTMLYVHIPFCDQICTFCRYARGKTPEREVMERYISALKIEMTRHLELPHIRETHFDLIYLGGGTPSVIPVDLMADLLSWILDKFPNGKREISFEGEARSLKPIEYLSMLKEHGVSRISMGVQSFQPRLRKLLGRKEGINDIEELIENANKFDLDVNFDLLYWLPYQTIEDLEKDIAQVKRLQPADIDWYNMVYDPLLRKDPLSRLIHKKRDTVAHTSGLIEMRQAMRDGCEAIGYSQPFVDNFSRKKDKDTYHVIRTGCYDGSGQTLGVGVSSLGTIGNFVYSNPDDLDSYYSALDRGKPIFKWVYDLEPKERQLERILFHFSRNMEFPKSVFDGIQSSVSDPYLTRLQDLIGRGLISESPEEYRLTETGKLWFSNIGAYLLNNDAHEDHLKRLYMKVLS